MSYSKMIRSFIGGWLALAIIVSLTVAAPVPASATSNNAELMRYEYKVIDGKMKVTADVHVKESETVSVLIVGYDKFGVPIEVAEADSFVSGGNVEVFEEFLEHGAELDKVEVHVLDVIEEPYIKWAEAVVAKEDHLLTQVVVKNGNQSQIVTVVATGYNKNGEVVEVDGESSFVSEKRSELFTIKLGAVKEIDHVKFKVLADDETYLVDYGSYVDNGKLIFTGVVKNGAQSQKITAKVTPYSANGKELSVKTDTSFTSETRLYNTSLVFRDGKPSQAIAKFYDEAGEEIKKRGTLVTIDRKGLAVEQPPVNLEGNVVVPMRAIFEALGASLEWDQDSQTVTAEKGSTEIKLQIGSDKAYINGQEQKLNVPAQLINNHTMVPVRFVSEALGTKVFWDQDAQTVLIVTE